MTEENFMTAKDIQEQLTAIEGLQTTNALPNIRVHVSVTTSNGAVQVHSETLKEVLGESTYNTICTTALNSINTQLASKKTDLEDDFLNL